MTQEQKERLRAWCDNLLVTYRIDFFRGLLLARVVKYLCAGGSHILRRNIYLCQEAERLGFEASSEDYIDLLASLNQIIKEVPLSDAAHLAIACVFGCEWEEAMEALDKLKSERNEQN
nr:MAG TPA: Sperm flagellar protein 1 alpha protein, CH domain [Caudoviricetes sp.]